jgi:uncharacterized protein YbbC (DUF1343 family)
VTVKTGLEKLIESDFSFLRGKKIGLLCNQASIDSHFTHIIDTLKKSEKKFQFSLSSVFGPQHGLWSHTQDNMIEWQGFHDKKTGMPVYSLYGEYRKPTPEMLKGLNALVIDLQDVGSRYYTFIWTMALCMEACQEAEIEIVVLDRPNPIGGLQVEGPLLDENYRSFVGWHSLPVRHGLTIGEIAQYFKRQFYPDLLLQVVPMQGWKREMYFEDTGLPWGVPSPNMPVPETALVYPGMCLIEATNISEGRGTTRPFEIFGAPWIEGWKFSQHLNSLKLPGAHFRPLQFKTTFNKYQGEVCEGCFVHVTDRKSFKPFLTGIAGILETVRLYSDEFEWKRPPYEYEYEKMPFDILVGNNWIRDMINNLSTFKEIEAGWEKETSLFLKIHSEYFLY